MNPNETPRAPEGNRKRSRRRLVWLRARSEIWLLGIVLLGITGIVGMATKVDSRFCLALLGAACSLLLITIGAKGFRVRHLLGLNLRRTSVAELIVVLLILALLQSLLMPATQSVGRRRTPTPATFQPPAADDN